MSNIKRAYSTFFFSILFVSIGYVIPIIYYNFLDFSSYLVVRYPMSLDKSEYNACDKQTLFSTYTAQFNIAVTSNNDLNKINEDGTFTKVFSEIRNNTFLEAEEKPFSIQIKVPCDIEPGIYFWSSVETYKVDDYIKNYSFTTDSFEVKKGQNAK
jgi:hypothetical protein